MNETIVENWNDRVSDGDFVFHIGDIGTPWGEPEALDWIDRCNGTKVLIMGNHDKDYEMDALEDVFEHVYADSTTIRLKNIEDFPGEYDGASGKCRLRHKPRPPHPNHFNVVGHVHDEWKFLPNHLNVSQDVWHFKPISRGTIKSYYIDNEERRIYHEDKDEYYDPWKEIDRLHGEIKRLKGDGDE